MTRSFGVVAYNFRWSAKPYSERTTRKTTPTHFPIGKRVGITFQVGYSVRGFSEVVAYFEKPVLRVT
jgi:hypothetical protein